MGDPDLSFEMLSAYVDGELPPHVAASIARLAAVDRRVAAQVAALQDLRAGVSGIAPEIVMVAVKPPTSRESPPAGVLAALGAIMLALAALVGFLGGDTAPGGTPPVALAGLIDRHDAWIAAGTVLRAAATDADPVDLLLAHAGLMTAGSASIHLPGGAVARHAGYIGQRGCRLSLFQVPRKETRAAEAIDLAIDGDEETASPLLTAHWSHAQTTFILIARGMDPVRFAGIASNLEAATDNDRDTHPPTIAEAAGANRPCIA
jgi:anti-sigma factor RsiW